MTKAELVLMAAKDAKVSKVAASAALDSFMTNVTKALKKRPRKIKKQVLDKDGNPALDEDGNEIYEEELDYSDCSVTLVGFGTFTKTRRKARKGRNPQTGAVIKIKARNVVKFRPGKKLRDAV